MSRSIIPDELKRTEVPASLPMTYLHFNPGPGKPLLVFFHGYSDSAAGFLKRAFPELNSQFEILAPNGLFPIPVQKEYGWKRTFAWYFADFSKNETVIPPTVAAEAVEHLIEKLQLRDRPKILLGFSQGGFFLPFVFPRLKNVSKMFAIGAAYRPGDYSHSLPIALDAFHGDSDEVITLQRSKESFEHLKEKNPQGTFYEFKGLGHTMNEEARALLKEKIYEVFP